MNVRYTIASLGLALFLCATAVPMAQAAGHPNPINWPEPVVLPNPINHPGGRVTPNPITTPWPVVRPGHSLSRPHWIRAYYGQFGGPPFIPVR
jgi:hypothetical protein